MLKTIGGAQTLAEMCMAGDVGLDAPEVVLGNRIDAALFGEGQSRIVLALEPGSREALAVIANGLDVPFEYIGTATSDGRLRLGPIDVSLDEMSEAFGGSLERALGGGGS